MMASMRLLVIIGAAAAWVAPRPTARRPSARFFLDQLLRGAPASVDAEAAELYELLAAAWAQNAPVDDARASALVDALAATERAFDVDSLGGGRWLSLYTRGPKPKWQKNAELVTFVRNRSGQTYDVQRRAVVNYGEILGEALSFSAEGTFAPRGGSRTPVDVDVSVTSGAFTAFGRRLGLPISGPGLLRVRYVDDKLRVFESPTDSPDKWEESGLMVVQVREALLT